MHRLNRRVMMTSTAVAAIALPALAQAPLPAGGPRETDWLTYGNDLANTRYAPLDQINADNFGKLEIAWRFDTARLGPYPEFRYETTPIVIKGRLYATAGSRRDVVCLDAGTGEVQWLWRLDEGKRAQNAPRRFSGRGLSYWTDGNEERILYVSQGYRLVALDAKTGLPCPGFGENGIVDLKKDNDQEIDPDGGEIGLNATPTVAGDVVIVGMAGAAEVVPGTKPRAKGYVRGFDARTGKRLWIFHTIPRKGEFGYDTWLRPGEAEKASNTGCWAQISVDPELGLAYLGIEIPPADEVGIHRQGPSLFSGSLVAVDLHTGQRKWHFQLVHHDIWDRDVPCAAILCDIPHEGKIVKALAQPSKQAFLYVLNRETGEPIWPIVERKAPLPGDVPGEWYSPTQPIPTKPAPYDVQAVTADTIIDFTPELHAKGLQLISYYRHGAVYTPPTLATWSGKWGTLTSLATQGGTNWAGGCYDPESHIVYAFSETTVSPTMIVPSVPGTSDYEYVRARSFPVPKGAVSPDGFKPGDVTVDGLPLMKPPYGRITAIDLTSGDFAWQIAHGETPDEIRNHPALKGLNIPRTGQTGLIGPTVTRSLVICGEPQFTTTATGQKGAMLRAYDKATGAERGAVYMPAPQTGCPMTYMHEGRQYIVLAISGRDHPGELIAYRLPSGEAQPTPRRRGA
ncbi:MAG: PQQ-binding-like beta-propeller repeat protein [Alphaproteobacteria bacterium]|nr:PQQ-binding-like beta-propeller repeat protein [Alphaproteobacteria bacterium]